jgi:uncharacterized membrane protein YkoI
MKRFLVIAALLAAAAPVASAAQDYGRPSLGASRDDQDQARAGVRAGRQVPLARVLAMIGQRTPGKHLNTTQNDYNGRPAYFVQWQKSGGAVVVFIVDAETGQMLGQQGG